MNRPIVKDAIRKISLFPYMFKMLKRLTPIQQQIIPNHLKLMSTFKINFPLKSFRILFFAL